MDASPGFKAGFVALLGRPNAGKSTLTNALLNFPLSIVSPKPQTTRHRILGIVQAEGWQACLLDTPGLLDSAKDKLQDALIRTARRAAREDADVLLLLVEPGVPAENELKAMKSLVSGAQPLVLVVNKMDQDKDRSRVDATLAAYSAALSPAKAHAISALKKEGLDALRASLRELLPESPPYYEGDRLSDRWERFFVAEIIRAGIFEAYREEVPHACAVDIEDFKETKGKKDLIRATIYVERSSQKPILLGPGGKSLRELTSSRTKAIELFLGRKVELDLWVKVKDNWRKNPAALKAFGYLD
ncbi:MAG TPA: GTPase Era [Elusimicrobiota bacterium]|jgi:GTP-binding protein Era|nr:GTPase Era [Elusimicrobiota bacterium]